MESVSQKLTQKAVAIWHKIARNGDKNVRKFNTKTDRSWVQIQTKMGAIIIRNRQENSHK